MCLAVPMKIKKINNEFADAQTGALIRKVNIQLLPDIKIGDYVIVHAGFAIQKIDARRAKETLKLLDEIR